MLIIDPNNDPVRTSLVMSTITLLPPYYYSLLKAGAFLSSSVSSCGTSVIFFLPFT